MLLRAAGNIGRDPGAISFRIGGKLIDLDDGTSDEIGYVYDVEQCDVTKRDLLAADRATAPDDRERARPKIDVLVDRIREYLADGGWHPSIRVELEAEGFSGGTIHDAQSRVVYARKTPGTMNGAWQWRLKSSNSADTPTDRDASRAGGHSRHSDTPTDQDINPINIDLSECRTSSTTGYHSHPDLSECQVYEGVRASQADIEADVPTGSAIRPGDLIGYANVCSCADGGEGDERCERCYGSRVTGTAT